MTATERFLKYIRVPTQSEEGKDTIPSTSCQFDLAQLLAKELEDLGLEEARVNEHAFVTAVLPATAGCEDLPCVGLLAHMDTAPAFAGDPVRPVLHPDYDGKDVLLEGSGDTLSVQAFPHLPSLKGQTLITTDGKTLLGADDKAGVAEIMTCLETLVTEKLPHGKIAVAFTPDEETGMGVSLFDVESFGARYAYTVDGGPLGELSCETFNACEATVCLNGVSVHPGSAKDTMINACLLAVEFQSMLPKAENPRNTEGYEGFFHLEEIKGDCAAAKLVYIVRDHDANRFEIRKAQMKHIAQVMNSRWGEGRVVVHLREQYRNMLEAVQPYMFLVDNAKAAMEKTGLVPFQEATRGGTDGCQLSFRGLPCPNLCTGGYAFHGPFEHITSEALEACSRMLVELMNPAYWQGR